MEDHPPRSSGGSRLPIRRDAVSAILDLLKKRFGVDTTSYDVDSAAHCVENRVMLRCFRALDDYMELLRTNDEELQELRDELAGAASLPEAFDELEREVIPRLPATTGRPAPRDRSRETSWCVPLEPPSEAPGHPEWVSRGKQFLLNQFAPPSVLVDSRFHVVHTFCGGGRFLRHPDGRPSLNILDLVAPTLRTTLTGGLKRASRDAAPATYGRVRVPADQGELDVRVSVFPIVSDHGEPHYLVVLEPQEDVAAAGAHCVPEERLRALEQEHRQARDALHAAIEELGAMNAELRSAVEELELANADLQGANTRLSATNTNFRSEIRRLEEEREDTDALTEATNVGILLLSADLRIRRFTGLAARIFQLLPQDIGRTFQTFANVLDRPDLLATIESAVDQDRVAELDVGSRSSAWYRLRIVPLRGKRLEGAALSFVDISAFKQTTGDLWLASRVFRDGAEPVVIESLDGRILAINTEGGRAYGWNPDDLVGLPADTLVARECVERARKLKARCRELERVRKVELMHRTKQGGRRPVLVTLALLRDERDRPAAIATVAEDIGRLKRAEREARLAVRRRDHFLAMLSHELRNPLGALQSAACVMQRRDEDRQAMARALEVVQRQTRHMARLLDDLLDVSRITQGKIEIRRETVDIVELAQDCLQSLRSAIEGRGQHLHVDMAAPPLFIRGDPSRLIQILENLLTNASKYTHEGGDIWFTLERCAEEAIIRIKDSGEGIPGEMLESIFELFTQSRRTSARSNGGMGVGLMLVRTLTRLHGGDVRAQSDGPGRGAEFVVRLPLKRGSSGSRPPSERRATTGKRILIVEDNADARDMLKTLLELDGFEVRVAGDGVSALQAITEEPPDIALIDIGLPGFDGLHLARRIREALGATGVRLVALTGFGRSEDRRAITDVGFDAHLVKPVVREELYAALQQSPPGITSHASEAPPGGANEE